MKKADTEALMDFAMFIGGAHAEVSQQVAALVNTLKPEERARYEKQLARLRAHGDSTIVAAALETLRQNLLQE